MFNSFLIKVKSISRGEIDNIAVCLYRWLWDLARRSKEIGNLNNLHNEVEHRPFDLKGAFSVTSFLGQARRNSEIEEGKCYFFRICTLKKELFSLFSSRFFRMKMEGTIFEIGDVYFNVMDIICDKAKSKWAFSMSEGDLEKLLCRDADEIIKIKIVSPMAFKIGDSFSCDINPRLIYGNLLKKFNKYSYYDLNRKVIDELSKTKISLKNERTGKIILDRGSITGIAGDLTAYINNVDDDIKKLIKLLWNFGAFSGVGYKTEVGYGQIELYK